MLGKQKVEYFLKRTGNKKAHKRKLLWLMGTVKETVFQEAEILSKMEI